MNDWFGMKPADAKKNPAKGRAQAIPGRVSGMSIQRAPGCGR